MRDDAVGAGHAHTGAAVAIGCERDGPRCARRSALSSGPLEHRWRGSASAVAQGLASAPASVGDGDPDDARDTKQRDELAIPGNSANPILLMRQKPDDEHWRSGKHVGVQGGPPHRLESESRPNNVFAVSHFDGDDRKVGDDPRVGGPPGEMERRVGSHVACSAGD
eukprot:scaffold9607_cov113-Isochrysis_galbana.AAC.3